MRIFNDSFTIQSEARPTFHDVTDRVAAAIKKQGVKTGVAMVYSQHTTCSVLIQEQSDDVNYYGEQLIPVSYTHLTLPTIA